MTERWQRELGVLDRLEPSADVLERATQGPRLPMARPNPWRRAAIAALALAVAAGGAVGAFAAIHGLGTKPGNRPATGGVAFTALWPERSYGDTAAVQERADAGNPAVQWRLDPVETAKRFASDVLGWKETTVSSEGPYANGWMFVELSVPPPPCPSPGCPEWMIGRVVDVNLDRLVRGDDTGIWSVIRASAPEGRLISLGGDPGQDLEAGTTFTLTSHPQLGTGYDLPKETELQAGSGYTCGGTTTYVPADVRESDGVDKDGNPIRTWTFEAGDHNVSADCSSISGEALDHPMDGFVYIAVVHGADPDKPWYPLAGPPPAGETVVTLSLLPVRFTPASG